MTNQFTESQPSAPVSAYLSLGSNLGDRLLILREALHRLDGHDKIRLSAWASVYETDPVGYTDQPLFLNTVIKIKTTLSPRDLLSVCNQIEEQFERDRSVRWGPRTLDIDILTYDNLQMSDEVLTLPHPEMDNRDFVLIPLQELENGTIGCTKEVRPLYENWYDRHLDDSSDQA